MQRDFQLQRGVIDLETGEFPVTLFTNGEASDGHIIDVRGIEIGETLPMFSNHNADPIARMGQLHSPKKTGKQTQLGGGRLRMVGRIDLEGDSQAADIRRDVAQGIAIGDITGMSGRWDHISEPVARSALPKGHYAFSETAANAWTTPLFFETSRAMEGSIVGVGSDQAALIGRSQDLKQPEYVREFYRSLASGDPATVTDAMDSMVPELEEIETESGAFMVPRDVAAVWGQSLEEELDPDVLARLKAFAELSDERLEAEAEELQKTMLLEAIAEKYGTREEAKALSEAKDEQPEPRKLESVRNAVAPGVVAAIVKREAERDKALRDTALKKLRYRLLGRLG